MSISKRSAWAMLCLMGSCALALSAQAASFDCEKAINDVDKIICGNEELSKLDERLSIAYKKALAGSPDQAQFKREQREWLKIRNKACYVLMGLSTMLSTSPDEQCLIDLYKDRAETLEYEAARKNSEREQARAVEGQLSMGVAAGEHFEIHPMYQSDRNLGHGYSICEALVRWANLNAGEMKCPAEIVHRMPGLDDVEWQTLDPKKYEELIYKIYLLSAMDNPKEGNKGWEIYFGDHRSEKWQDGQFQQNVRSKVATAIGDGLKIWRYRGRFSLAWQANSAELTIVRLEYPDAHCSWDTSKSEPWSIAFVTSDLKELDKEVYSHQSFVRSGLMIKRWKGQTFFIDATEFDRLRVDRAYGDSICEISANNFWRTK